MNKEKYLNNYLFWSIFILVAGCFVFILAAFPRANDDWWVLRDFQEYGFYGAFHHRFLYDNTRLGNFLGMALIPVPLWIPKAISMISFVIGLWLMTKVCGLRPSQWQSLALLSFFVWVAPMWEDAMFSHMYSFNYVVSIPLLFGLIYMFLNPKKCPLWIGIVLGILLGAWHEAYSIVFLSGSLLNLILNGKENNKYRWWLFIAVSIGLLWFFVTPAIYYRNSYHPFSLWYLYKFVYCWIYFLFLAVYIYACFKYGGKIGRNPLYLFTVASGVMLIIILKVGMARAFMPAILVACCGLTHLLAFLLKKRQVFFTVIASLCMIFTTISLIATCVETVKVRKVADSYADKFKNAEEGEKYAFGEARYPWDAPAVTLRRPDFELLIPGKRNTDHLTWLYKNGLTIVPEVLREYSVNQGRPLSADSTIRLWHGHIVSSNLNDTSNSWVSVKYGPITDFGHFRSVVFKTNDNNEFVYIVPYRGTISTYLGEPQSISFK